MRKVRIALASLSKPSKKLKENQNKVVKFIKQAAKKKAKIVVFPELMLYFVGKEMPTNEKELLDPVVAVCREYNIWCIAPTNIEINRRIQNRAYLISNKGEVAGHTEKHYGFYDKYIGTRYPIFKTGFGKIGILICYDLGFEKPARMLANKGAEIIFSVIHYGAEEKGDQAQFVRCFPFARAYEHKIFVCAVNVAHKFPYAGIASPKNIIKEYKGKDEKLLIGEVNLDELKKIKKFYWGKSLVHEEDVKKYKWLSDNLEKEKMIYKE